MKRISLNVPFKMVMSDKQLRENLKRCIDNAEIYVLDIDNTSKIQEQFNTDEIFIYNIYNSEGQIIIKEWAVTLFDINNKKFTEIE